MPSSSPQLSANPSAKGLVLWGLGAPAPLEHVLSFAPAADAVATIPCSRFWAAVAGSDVVWTGKCRDLWAGKVYVPERFLQSGQRIAAYWGSLADATRCAITTEELCAFEWSARMKGWAGPDWTTNDPWWQDQPAATRTYCPDGSVQTAGRGSSQWRFVPESGGCKGPTGSFLRHTRNGRDYPTHFVSRWPRNWGWVLQNCWGFSTSFPLPPRGAELELEDDGALCQSVTVDTCRDEAMRFNMGLPLPFESRPREGLDDGGFVTVLVNGTEQQLSAALVAALVSAHQQAEAEGDDETDD